MTGCRNGWVSRKLIFAWAHAHVLPLARGPYGVWIGGKFARRVGATVAGDTRDRNVRFEFLDNGFDPICGLVLRHLPEL